MKKTIVCLLLTILYVITGLEATVLPKSTSKQKLAIDHDGGADDAMAIFMCLLYEKYFDGPEVVALTTLDGNVNESQVLYNSQRLLNEAGRRDVSIYRGATRSVLISHEYDYYFGYDGLGDNPNVTFEAIEAEKEHAAFALIELSKLYEGQLKVMAIGPLTNIAYAVRLDPGFIGRLSQLYIGAGHIYSQDFLEPEFNALMDVEAYKIVVEAASVDKVTVLPFSQLMKTLELSKEWRKDVLGAIPTTMMQALNSYERISLAASDSWVNLDPCVAAVVLEEDVVDVFKNSSNGIDVCGAKRGINTNEFESNEPNVRLVYSAKIDYYKKLLVDIFSAELNA